jgi:hypothetical protein
MSQKREADQEKHREEENRESPPVAQEMAALLDTAFVFPRQKVGVGEARDEGEVGSSRNLTGRPDPFCAAELAQQVGWGACWPISDAEPLCAGTAAHAKKAAVGDTARA